MKYNWFDPFTWYVSNLIRKLDVAIRLIKIKYDIMSRSSGHDIIVF